MAKKERRAESKTLGIGVAIAQIGLHRTMTANITPARNVPVVGNSITSAREKKTRTIALSLLRSR